MTNGNLTSQHVTNLVFSNYEAVLLLKIQVKKFWFGEKILAVRVNFKFARIRNSTDGASLKDN